ncbi:MAG: hypothetical protein GXP50_11925 [Deltaproteobacteria bacterium]|nr:hypothetical protein [Deltaproteobacteria bacterium]
MIPRGYGEHRPGGRHGPGDRHAIANRRRSNRGTVLVAAMVILALLSLLGAGSLLNATLDTQLARNQATSKEAFYAAEAALEVGVGRVMAAFRDELRPYTPGPTADWTEPSTAGGDPYDNPFNGFTTEFKIINSLDPNNPGAEPDPFLFTTVENNQQIIHFAYEYQVEARATSALGSESMAETVRVLETPLVQYYIFFEDDLSWHNGPTMNSWGRVHTNGNLYFAPGSGGIWFRDYDNAGAAAPHILTVHGEIYSGKYLFEGNTIGTRSSGPVRVRVRNLTSPPTIPVTTSDCEEINTSITATNAETQEARFVDANGTYHVRVGVDRMPSASYQTLARGGFYEAAAADPKKPDVDGMKIVVEGGALKIYFTPNGGVQEDVTDLVYNYWVDALGNPVNFGAWPAGARTMADGNVATALSQIQPGTIVYSPESPVTKDDSGAGSYDGTRGNMNPWYPCILERRDPRENKEVDFTVIDLQRLELWYRDYLDWSDNGSFDGSVDPFADGRSLLIYVSRSLSGGGFASGTGAGNLQSVKIIGSRAGRTRTTDDRQHGSSPTLITRTSVVTDNPVYLDGDLNVTSPGGSDAPAGPGGLAIVSDAVTLLSNNWGPSHNGQTGGTYTKNAASNSAFNAALFTGRFDFRSGGSGEEAGIHNFPRFIESWSGRECHITGCLINLWFSQQATAEFRCCGTGTGDVYTPPQRFFGWDVNFQNQDYWPPYVPSIYSVERASWRED